MDKKELEKLIANAQNIRKKAVLDEINISKKIMKQEKGGLQKEDMALMYQRMRKKLENQIIPLTDTIKANFSDYKNIISYAEIIAQSYKSAVESIKDMKIDDFFTRIEFADKYFEVLIPTLQAMYKYLM